jgi:CRP-like cAMP-binding protein
MSFASILRKIPALAEISDKTLEEAASHFQTKKYKAGDLILKQGEVNEDFYIITSGVCCMMMFLASGATARKGSTQVGKPLKRFDSFGQTDVVDVTNPQRLTSVHALKDTTCLCMTRSMLSVIKPGFGHAVDAKVNTVDHIPLFQTLTTEERQQVADKMLMQEWNHGDYIVQQGQAGARFFVITKGACEVFSDDESGAARSVATLYENDFFGERAFEDASNLRSNSVGAIGNVITVSIGRDAFKLVKEKLQPVLLQVAAMREMRSRALTTPSSRPRSGSMAAIVDITVNASPTNARNGRKSDREMAVSAAAKFLSPDAAAEGGESPSSRAGERNRLSIEIEPHMSSSADTAQASTQYMMTLYMTLLQRMQRQPDASKLFPEMARKRLQIPSSVSGARILQRIVKEVLEKPDWQVQDEEAEMVRAMVQRVPLVQKLCKKWSHQQKKDLCKKMSWAQFAEEEVVFEEGQKGDSVYIILRGFAVCAQTRGMNHKVVVATLGPGESFGDLALRGLAVRTNTIKVLPGDVLQCMVLSQRAHAAVMGYTQGYSVEERHQFLTQTKLFEGLDRYEVFRFAFHTELARYSKGEVLVRGGEEAGALYFILEGTAKLVPKGEEGGQKAEMQRKAGKGRELGGGSRAAGGSGGGSGSGGSGDTGSVVHGAGGAMEVKQQGEVTIIMKEASTSFIGGSSNSNNPLLPYSPIAPARRAKVGGLKLCMSNMTEHNLSTMGEYGFFGASSVVNHQAAAAHTSTLKVPKVVVEPSTVVVESGSMLVLLLPPEAFGLVKPETMSLLTRATKAQQQWRQDRRQDLRRAVTTSFQNRRSEKALELEESNSFGEWGAWPSQVKKAREAAKKAGEKGKGEGDSSSGVSLWLNKKADAVLNAPPPPPVVLSQEDKAIRGQPLTQQAAEEFLRYAVHELTAAGSGPGDYAEKKKPFDTTRLAMIGKERGFDEFLSLPRIKPVSAATAVVAPTPIKPRRDKGEAAKTKKKRKALKAKAGGAEKLRLTDAPSPADFAASVGSLPPSPPPRPKLSALQSARSLPSLSRQYVDTPDSGLGTSTFVTQGFDGTMGSTAGGTGVKPPGAMKQSELIASILGRQTDRMTSLRSEKEALDQEVMAAMAALHHASRAGHEQDPGQYSLSSLLKLQHVHIGGAGESAEPLTWGWGG